jgi:hypothetical protein
LAHSIYVLDGNSNAVNAISLDIGGGKLTTQPVWGAIAGWKGLSYTPSGGMIDGVPQNGVQVPLSDWRNLGVGLGAQLLIWDDDLGDEATRGPIVGVDDTVDERDVHWATITFSDLLDDLVRADVTSSFASDIGHTNAGPADPVPTRAAETLSTTMLRLVQLADTDWVPVNDVIGLDGIAFTATGSIIQAFDKLRQERFCHFRRELYNGTPRLMHLGNFGTPFIANGLPVWFGAPPPDPSAATYVAQVQMLQPRFTRKRDIVNSITPTGGGNGTAQLNLRVLYGVGGYTGYDPAHPIQRRQTASGATSDGFDYFIEDTASIAIFGRMRGPCPIPGIGITVSPAGTTEPVDETAAAISLYTAALASLHRSAYPVTQLTFVTPALGDIRNCGGMLVHVKYDGWSFDPNGQPYQYLNVDDDYVVTGVVRAEDEKGVVTDTWTVTTNGQAVASAQGTLLGAMSTLTDMHAAVQSYPIIIPYSKCRDVDADHPLRMYLPPMNNSIRTHWAIAFVNFEGVRHTLTDEGHVSDVTTGAMPHDVDAVPHDVNSLPIQFEIAGEVYTSDQNPVYSPSPTVTIFNNAPSNAAPVLYDGKNFYSTQGGQNKVVKMDATDLAIQHVVGTTDAHGNPVAGTGGKVKATTGAADAAAGKPNPGIAGGTVPTATHTSAAGLGTSLVKATVEKVTDGPLPESCTCAVDSGVVGTISATGIFDLTAAFSDQAGHEIEFRSPSIGAFDVVIWIARDIATVAVKPTG